MALLIPDILPESAQQLLQSPVAWVLAGLFIVLVIASIWVRVLSLRQPGRDLVELRLRVQTWWVLIGLVAISLFSGHTGSILLWLLVSYLAFKEYLSLVPTRRADHRVLFWAYLAIPVQYLWVFIGWYGMFIIFIPVYVFLLLPMRMVLIGETQGYLRAVSSLHWGLMTTVFSLSHVAFLFVLPGDQAPIAQGAGLALLLLVLTQSNDVAQYLWGKTFGGPKIIPKVSPGKTVAGFLGGVLTTALLAWALGPLLSPMLGWKAALVGAILAIAGFVGDVTISALKRDLGVKDSGSLLPGHGGILDRLDSLTYTAPIFFHLVRYFYYPETCHRLLG